MNSPRIFQLVGPLFVEAIKPIYGAEYTTELGESWKDIFAYIAKVMGGSMNDALQKQPTYTAS